MPALACTSLATALAEFDALGLAGSPDRAVAAELFDALAVRHPGEGHIGFHLREDAEAHRRGGEG